MENSSLELQLHDQFAAAAVQNVKMCKTCQMGDACRGLTKNVGRYARDNS